MRALVIDDSRAIRLILGQVMKKLGFEVVDAGDGQEATEKLTSDGPFDIALVDWNMPVMNGYDFVVNTRKNPKYNDMRLMMVTTETEMAQVVKALEAGANEYVMKPFTKEMIAEKLSLLGLSSE